ncbi:hypothetical protein COM55_12585 [Bacillus pseudomycoides]|uniref:YxiG family protein n=1 Tax=Bacillus pseudomycoides TaxID=64104 RepID=UPI000BF0AD27|nr:hypothetical protein [Bacillus pseudomycoides]PEK59402.1 hypothetical protein CN590_25385 [Bacillus pseudomycoides]PGE85258.1 hypothetical protein COM55_12585 [Bacillus pseudomycoides]
MKDIEIQSILDDLWGAKILDTHMDLLNDNINFTLQVIDDGVTKDFKIVFMDVSAFYYVKDDENLRFEFYDREKVNFLELTTIYYQDPNLSEVKFNLQNEKKWSSQYSTGINIIMEIWDSILLVEARRLSLNGEVIHLKM